MARGRPSYSFFLFDSPSDHEIDGSLSTECQIIKSILHNRSFHSVVKTETASSKKRFDGILWRPYPGLGFVHVAGHGSRRGLEFIGGRVTWLALADKLKIIAPALANDQQRVLSLSCCHSMDGLNILRPLLKEHYTGIYFYKTSEVLFSDAITTYAMFYIRKTINKPHKKIIADINGFLGKDLLAFARV